MTLLNKSLIDTRRDSRSYTLHHQVDLSHCVDNRYTRHLDAVSNTSGQDSRSFKGNGCPIREDGR